MKPRSADVAIPGDPSGSGRVGRSGSLAAAIGLAVLGALGGCVPLAALNRALAPTSGFALTEDVAYGADPRQRLDVYAPRDLAAPAPVVVFLYGGAWSSGSREYYRFMGEALTSRGFVVAIPDYRLYPDVVFPSFVVDGASATRWIHDHARQFGGDPAALFLMGHSAGAHTAALLATDRRYLADAGVPRETIRGVVGLAGPYDLAPERYRITRRVFAPAIGGDDANPLSFVDGDEPPMLLLHGGADDTVWPVNSRALAWRAEAVGGRAQLIEYPGVGHIGIVLGFARPFRSEGGPLDEVSWFISSVEAALGVGMKEQGTQCD